MAGKTVCVTGGSGYIASWLIKKLLELGYTVKASVRYPDDPKKTHHLLSLAGAKERLKLFKADLLEEGSFDAAIDGCDGVFHCASPFFLQTTKPQEELIDPAVKGTVNVLGSCAKFPSVKRVILTSSEAAIAFNRTPRTADAVIDETWWADPDYCKENQMWYVLSKRLAEGVAWDIAKEKGIDLISINPSCVIGPMLQPTLNTSSAQVLDLINGAETYPNTAYGWVHVNDVVDAHILAYEKPEANGRYYVVERAAHPLDLINILRELYPNLKYPEKCADDNPLVPAYKVNTERAKKLGVVFTPLKQALKDTVESLKEKGFFKGE
ncbi:Flavonol reductase/cinnamoyl-CoA reductase [Handroanthus impetiginosus]|uniref:Dihydroflavonol 4-reductase n=1 Tax=Handroanthus impetiginosus TaxID=429701 RepID=A0A2G9GQI7_9LAMI|nr:Flavonol reductase/cinnamoyl-CoA reductase [Handroanthus impetiginosus]